MSDSHRIERALLSCFDKTGLEAFAYALAELGVALVATEGTVRLLQAADIPVTTLSDYTGIPELLEGRVKSLHPRVHAGLLAVRDNKLHAEQLQAYDIPRIDLAVVNLQPLDALLANQDIPVDEVLEQVDIGGAAMLRSAAKNFRYVTPVVNPENYSVVLHEIRAHEGSVSYTLRYRLAQEAFAAVADYDRKIAEFLARRQPREE